jgi:hypothetical protein
LVEHAASYSSIATLAVKADEAVLHVPLQLTPFSRGRDLGTRLEDERGRVVIRRDARLQHVNIQAQRRRRVAVGSAGNVAAHQGVVVE